MDVNNIAHAIRSGTLMLDDEDVIFGVMVPDEDCGCNEGVVEDGSLCPCMSRKTGQWITFKELKEIVKRGGEM